MRQYIPENDSRISLNFIYNVPIVRLTGKQLAERLLSEADRVETEGAIERENLAKNLPARIAELAAPLAAPEGVSVPEANVDITLANILANFDRTLKAKVANMRYVATVIPEDGCYEFEISQLLGLASMFDVNGFSLGGYIGLVGCDKSERTVQYAKTPDRSLIG